MQNSYKIPKIINGCWQLSKGHNNSSYDNTAVINKYIKSGLNVFDCADIYEGVESVLGEASLLDQSLRVHTKFVPDLDSLDSVNEEYVRNIIQRSCKRLHINCLDLVQFHWWDYNIGDYIKVLKYLENLRLEGQIKFIGLTNFNAEHLQRIIDSGVKIFSMQMQYSLLDNRPRKKVIDLCKKNHIKIFSYGTMSGGFLSESWLNANEPDELSNRSLIKYKAIIDDAGGWKLFQKLLSELSKISNKYSVSISDVVISYILFHTEIDSMVLGISNKSSVEDLINMQTNDFLSEKDVKYIDGLRSLFNVSGDVYDLERDRESAHGKIMKYNLSKN